MMNRNSCRLWRLSMALRVWLSVPNKYPAINTTPNINMPSYSQHAMRRAKAGVDGAAVVLSGAITEVVAGLVMLPVSNRWVYRLVADARLRARAARALVGNRCGGI